MDYSIYLFNKINTHKLMLEVKRQAQTDMTETRLYTVHVDSLGHILTRPIIT